jgi:AcrR family transcriptional regulator
MTQDPTERPAWLAPLADPKNEIILRAAFDIFQEHGLHCATMADVARRARVSKETLYARFDSKEGLFYALIAWGTRQSMTNGDAYAVEPIEDPVVELRNYARELMAGFMRPESLAVYRMAVSESGRNPEIGRSFDELSCAHSEGVLERVTPLLAARGLIEPGDREEMVHAFLGLLRGNYHHNALTGTMPIPTPDEVIKRADRAVELWLRAYSPPARARTAVAA